MEDLRLRIFDARPDDFWVAMGPLFASEKVRRELPYLRDEASRIWLVAFEDDGSVAGFSAMAMAPGKCDLCSLWVRPERRSSSDLAKRMLDTRVEYCRSVGVARLTSTANGRSRPLLERKGFRETGKRGSYVTMEMSL